MIIKTEDASFQPQSSKAISSRRTNNKNSFQPILASLQSASQSQLLNNQAHLNSVPIGRQMINSSSQAALLLPNQVRTPKAIQNTASYFLSNIAQNNARQQNNPALHIASISSTRGVNRTRVINNNTKRNYLEQNRSSQLSSKNKDLTVMDKQCGVSFRDSNSFHQLDLIENGGMCEDKEGKGK